MSQKPLGRLERVPLRQAWSSESGYFTPWLAQEENLALLGETIGLELEYEAQEKEVGPFRADILCRDTATDNWVLIENQLERTDHTHLGQLLTYAAGLNAVTIVWIAERFTDEHRAALDWLNEHTDEKINLFGLEIELWRIGDSSMAPKFNVISKPNDWTKNVQQAAALSGTLSPVREMQLKFWTAFRADMESRGSVVRFQTPMAQSWANHSIGRSGAHFASVASLWNSETGKKGPELRAELYLHGQAAKREFALLANDRERLESELGFPLTWYKLDDAASCRVFTRVDADFMDESRWPEQFDWLRQRLERMHAVLGPVVRNLKVIAAEQP